MRKRRKQRARSADRIEGPVNLIIGPAADSLEESCSCPICAELAANGVPRYTTDADGQLVELPPAKPIPTIEIMVRGDASTWPYLPLEAKADTVPEGCSVGDYLAYLGYRDRNLWRSFPPGGLTARIGGQSCAEERELRPGDVVTVSGVADREWSEVFGGVGAAAR